MVLKYLLEKEFKQFFRNKMLPALVFGMPVLFMIVFPCTTTMDVKNMKLAVVDNDHSVTSQQLIEKVASSDYFDISGYYLSNDAALQSVEYRRTDAILEIPPSFENDLVSTGYAEVLVSANAVDASKAGLGTSYLGTIVSEFSLELAGTSFSQVNSSPGAGISLGGIKTVPYVRFNPTMDYKIYMIPALIVLILTMVCGFLPSLNVVSEKEFGTIEQINVTPVRKSLFILGKLIPYWVLGTTMIIISMFLGWLIYGVWPQTNLFAIFLTGLIYIFTISSFGLIISNSADNMQQAMFLMFFFIIVLFLMSGIFTPIDSMPEWAKTIGHLSPVTYFAKIMRAFYLKGSSLADVAKDIYIMLGFLVILAGTAIASYRKRG